jgi:phosphatidylglycerol:prolipoprotein diacylglycerol transferase
MHPTLFTIGNFNIPTYTVLLDLGLILGLVLAYLEGKRLLGSGEVALDLGLWVIIGGIVGGRIGFVLVNWQIFAEEWQRAFYIWEGGLAFHGAFLGGMVVLAIYAWLQRGAGREAFWTHLDALTLGLAVGVVFGWAACLMGGCAYGATGEGFGYALLPDLFGVEASRFATQAVGLAYALVLLAGFWLLRGRWPFAGVSFLIYLLLYFAGQFFLEFTRGDEALYFGPWRLAQLLDIALVLALSALLLWLWWSHRNAAGEPLEEVDEIEAEALDTALTTDEPAPDATAAQEADQD